MKKLYRIYLLGFILLLLGTIPAQAQNSPMSLLQTTAHSMVDALNQNKNELKKDPLVVNRLVEKILLPHIDLISASKWVLGKHWRRADKKQKLQFIREFRTLLVTFYSSALADFLKTNEFNKDMIRFQPLRGDVGEEVTVRSEVFSPAGKSIPVNYHMHQTRKGWKVYDVSVEGISMITTYKTSFANEIKIKGVDGLIASLAAKNKAN
ncbi:MAG: ABC transporter substrate-binding protein [Gammaproteobacteria bacterium]|jgi:phospholipid transport system substrate-binding protein